MSVDRYMERTVRHLLLMRAAELLDPDHLDVAHDDHHELFTAIAERVALQERRRAHHRELVRALSHGEALHDGTDPLANLTKGQRRHLRKRLGLNGKVRIGRPPQTKHGTPGMVRKGCDCEACKAWRRERSKLDRQRRRQRNNNTTMMTNKTTTMTPLPTTRESA